MAKNWTLKEAVKIITAGENKEAIQELGKRFPLTTVAIAKIGQNEGVDALMSVMPDHVTMLKLERAFKEDVEESDIEDEEENSAATEDSDAEEQDLSEMTSKQLYALCVKKGIKAKKYGVNKQYYLALLNDGDNSDEEDADESDDSSEEAEVDYESMKAPELFALCKKRGIKLQPKQKAAVYIKALKAADEAEAAAADESWDDEDEEEEAPVKKTTKGQNAGKKTAPAKKSAKKEAEAEDDEDWDI